MHHCVLVIGARYYVYAVADPGFDLRGGVGWG